MHSWGNLTKPNLHNIFFLKKISDFLRLTRKPRESLLETLDLQDIAIDSLISGLSHIKTRPHTDPGPATGFQLTERSLSGPPEQTPERI